MKPIFYILSSLALLLVLIEHGSCRSLANFAEDDDQRERREAEDPQPIFVIPSQREKREYDDPQPIFVVPTQRDRREAEEEALADPGAERFRREIMNAMENYLGDYGTGDPDVRERRFLSTFLPSIFHGALAGVKHFFGRA